MDAENDVSAALSAIKKIQLTIPSDRSLVAAEVPQCQQTEQDLMKSVAELTQLKKQNRIHGDLLTLNELIDPSEEKEIGEESLDCDDDGIVDRIHREAEGGAASDNESELGAETVGTLLGHPEAVRICQQLEEYCLEEGGEHVLGLLHNLRRFRAQLRREMQNAKQITLEDVWGSK